MFYVYYIALILFIYLIYLIKKKEWMIAVREYILEQSENFSIKITEENKPENYLQEDFEKIKAPIINTTTLSLLEKLEVKNFYFIWFNPFTNNLLQHVKNKQLLLNVLHRNGEIGIDEKI